MGTSRTVWFWLFVSYFYKDVSVFLLWRFCDRKIGRFCDQKIEWFCNREIGRFCDRKIEKFCDRMIERFCDRKIRRNCDQKIERFCDRKILLQKWILLWLRKGSLTKSQTRILDRLFYTRKIDLHRKGKKSRTVRITPIVNCGISWPPHPTGKCGTRPFLWWVRAQGRSPHAPGISQKCLRPCRHSPD